MIWIFKLRRAKKNKGPNRTAPQSSTHTNICTPLGIISVLGEPSIERSRSPYEQGDFFLLTLYPDLILTFVLAGGNPVILTSASEI